MDGPLVAVQPGRLMRTPSSMWALQLSDGVRDLEPFVFVRGRWEPFGRQPSISFQRPFSESRSR